MNFFVQQFPVGPGFDLYHVPEAIIQAHGVVQAEVEPKFLN